MRGQAFIIFRDINSAMEAKRRNHGRELYSKTMVSSTPLRKYSSQRISPMSSPRSTALLSLERRMRMTLSSSFKRSLCIGLSSWRLKSNASGMCLRRWKMYMYPYAVQQRTQPYSLLSRSWPNHHCRDPYWSLHEIPRPERREIGS